MIDTHAHLDFEDFDQDREEVIARAFDGGIKKIINIGCDLNRAKKAIEIAEKYENIYAVVGVHPTDAYENFKFQISNFKILEELKTIAKHPKVVAIGEIGLDYFHMDSEERSTKEISENEIKQLKTRQKELFIAQLELASELSLPVVIHCRDAYEDLINIVETYCNTSLQCFRGVVHCFSGNLKQAKKLIDLGLYISFTGNITYGRGGKSSALVEEVVREISLEKIMVETDCPFLAPISAGQSSPDGPTPMRGKRNEPLFVKYVAEKIAKIKNIDVSEVEKLTDKNAEELFGV